MRSRPAPVSTEGFGSGVSLPSALAVKLHEDQIPELHVAIAVAAHRAGGFSAAVFFAAIDEDFAARAAGAGVAHGPEIVFFAEAVDAVFRNAFLLFPDLGGFVVFFEYGDVEAIFGKREFFCDEFPGEVNRFFFEVIAEREVSEHFEKSVVTRGEADVFQIVVLAAGADAFLRSRGAGVGALVFAEKNVFELNHSGVSKEEGRIVFGNETGTRDDRCDRFFRSISETWSEFRRLSYDPSIVFNSV